MYVALGDSYAAGVGAGPRLDDCWRSDSGYPPLVAAALDADLSFQACIGASTLDVLGKQVQALSADTAQVTLTVGGNDAGFTQVLISAAEPSWMSDSEAVIAKARAFIRTELPGRLDRLYAEVRRRAPSAVVIVTTYPRLFNGTDCEVATFFSDTEMTELNQGADELASVIVAAAGRAGFAVADVRAEFVHHAVCDPVEWVRGVSWPIEESFHPNAQGAQAYADSVDSCFGVTSSGVPAPAQRVTAAAGGRVDATVFALPDLGSARSLAGAAAHGIDPDEVDSLARRANSTDPAADSEAAWARLHELDRQCVRR